MGLGARVRRGQPAEARDIGGQFQNAFVVDVVEHGDAKPQAPVARVALASYIGRPNGNEEGRVRGRMASESPNLLRGDSMNDFVKPAGASARRLRIDRRVKPSREEAEAAVRTLIAWAGDDPTREGLLDTPRPGGQSL